MPLSYITIGFCQNNQSRLFFHYIFYAWSVANEAWRSTSTTPSTTSYDRPNRLKGREDGIIRWGELLEKFRSVQERARRAQRVGSEMDDGPTFAIADLRLSDGLDLKNLKEGARPGAGPPVPLKDAPALAAPVVKPRSGLGRQFGRLGGAVSGRGKRGQQ